MSFAQIDTFLPIRIGFSEQFQRKTAPGVPGTEKDLFAKELADLLLEGAQCLNIAIGMYMQGAGIVKADHAHEALCVYLLHVVSHKNGEGLDSCQRDELLHILKGTKGNIKFLHRSVLLCTKQNFSCIMKDKLQNALSMKEL